MLVAALLVPFGFEMGGGTSVEAVAYITRTFTVTNSIGSAQSNYPIEVNLSTSAEITAGRMRSDCGDIRVWDSNFVTQFTNYTIIGCNTTFTSIIYIDPLLATGAQTHYITYGEPTLAGAENPSAVFDIWDLHTGTTTPSCTLAGSATWDNTNKWAQLTPNSATQLGTCNYSYLSSLTSRGYKAFFDAWTGGSAGGDATWLYSFSNPIPTEEDIVSGGGAHFTLDEFQDRYCYTESTTTNGACTATFASATIDNSTWRRFEVSWDTTTKRLFENGTQRINTTAGTARTITNTNFGFGGAYRREHE